ncbi:MAG TPA: MarC family protein [Burkholderiales bacterium]|nr:MarC family protein [Burkholderiales bacterium]
MEYNFFSATVLLLLVFDPFGSIPVFAAALDRVAVERRRVVLCRECVIAFAVLAAFLFGGEGFLQLMHLSNASLQLSGGIVLFLIALRMIFPSGDGIFGALPEGEPMVFPLAVPMLAGPSALATVLLLGAQQPERKLEWLGALALATIISALILSVADRLQRRLGEPVVAAFERLMGLILSALAVEMLLSGLRMIEVIA